MSAGSGQFIYLRLWVLPSSERDGPRSQMCSRCVRYYIYTSPSCSTLPGARHRARSRPPPVFLSARTSPPRDLDSRVLHTCDLLAAHTRPVRPHLSRAVQKTINILHAQVPTTRACTGSQPWPQAIRRPRRSPLRPDWNLSLLPLQKLQRSYTHIQSHTNYPVAPSNIECG